eukprot:270770_1
MTDLPLNLEGVIGETTFFLTGGTGFLGHYVLYKLLTIQQKHDVSNKKIYLLIRANKQYSAVVDRLNNEVLNNRLFKDIKHELLQNVVPIKGDLLSANDKLGINEDDLRRLRTANITMWIHCAASISFNEEFNAAMNINVNGTFQCLNVIQSLNIRNYLHVSTAYCNLNMRQQIIEERIYPQTFNGAQLFYEWKHKESKQFSKKRIHQLFKNGDWVNTYVFTKNISESVVYDFCTQNDIQFGIIRCGIIGAAIDGWYHKLRSCPSFWIMANSIDNQIYVKHQMSGTFEAIPVDLVVNDMLLMSAAIITSKTNAIITHSTKQFGSETTNKRLFIDVCKGLIKDERFELLRKDQQQACYHLSKTSAYIKRSDIQFYYDLMKEVIRRKKSVSIKRVVLRSIGVRKAYSPFWETNQVFAVQNMNAVSSLFDHETKELYSTDFDFSNTVEYYVSIVMSILLKRRTVR